MIQLFLLHVVVFVEKKVSKGHIGSLGQTMLYLGFTVLGKAGWLYSSCHIPI